ncbi:MAG: DUF5103 domain-containing protein [Tannerella sp.]|jgi:hypothetical protein|nr:DUF5103 domain-containing protein [Tannerella sp.]
MVVKKLWSTVLTFIFLCNSNADAATVYETKIYSNQVKSLRLKVNGQTDPMPVININGGMLEVNFDILNYTRGRYAYSITCCNADWQKSTLSDIEYLDGFQGMTIEDYSQSVATTTLYRNYRLFLPNDDVGLKIAGNYILEVYEEDNPQKVLFTARFAVIEKQVDITGTVHTHTDIDFNKEHQQVDFEIDYRRFPVANPQNDLKVYVFQNTRTDNMKTGFRPQSITGNSVSYKHIPELIFEAGNEYRRIEFLTHRFGGMGIERIQYFNPYYHADAITDKSRAQRAYQYDQDQNGRFFINCSDCEDPDTEADYYIVHFAYEAGLIPKGNLYINGDLVQNQLNGNTRMEYNPETGLYEKALLLKQGHYNYQYLHIPENGTEATPAIAEGNYYQTENEYAILVYYRPPSARYDRLIGKQILRNQQ